MEGSGSSATGENIWVLTFGGVAEEGEEEEDVELLPDPVPQAGEYADPQKVRERFLAGRKLSESRIPLPPVGGEGAFEKD